MDLSQEEVFDNDMDPLEAIREIRREEGVAEEDLPISESDTPSEETLPVEEEGKDELDALAETPKEDLPADVVEETAAEDGEDPVDDLPVDDTAPAESETRKFTANGQEFEFTQEEILDQFETVFGQAMDYTQKTQKIAPFRKMISALENEGITAEQLNTAIDALKGNKDAIQSLITNNNIDTLDLASSEDDTDNTYTPPEFGKDESVLAIEEVSNRISSDPEYKITVNVIDEQWDQKSRNVLSSNPNLIAGLHNDIKSGMYDKVAPVAMKMKVLDGNTKSDIDYYMLAGEQVSEAAKQDSAKAEKSVEAKNQEAQALEDESDQASSEAKTKRSASSTRARSDRKGVTDYLDDDDEAYDAWYKNLQDSQ